MRYLVIPALFLAVTACSDNSSDPEKADSAVTKESRSVTDKMKVCDCHELTDSLELTYLHDKPFSGKCFSNYPETNDKYEELTYMDGIIQSARYFGKDGKLLTETLYDNGKAISDVNSCDCGELEFDNTKIPLAKLNGSPFTGFCVSNYPETNDIYKEERFRNGLRTGKSIVYSKSGSILSITTYVNGVRNGSNAVYDNNGNLLFIEYFDEKGNLDQRVRY